MQPPGRKARWCSKSSSPEQEACPFGEGGFPEKLVQMELRDERKQAQLVQRPWGQREQRISQSTEKLVSARCPEEKGSTR